MNFYYKLAVLILIDIIVIWLWVYQIDPDPSLSIGILLLVPFVLILNLIIATILYFFKRKTFSKLFLINSIIASIIMFHFFKKGIDRHQDRVLENWTFQKADTTFSLIRWKESNQFSMSYSLNPGSSWGFLDGKYYKENSDWILIADSLKMKIANDSLIGFRKISDTIEMQKINN
ncbi:hypothetical protein [Salegentibacter chungangensis]|uniref:Uncharacterized protein n=1 Tax=Salegentibacter chungangensis TaxID=1335724 RepID=A0ABW3NUT7_9FLAO